MTDIIQLPTSMVEAAARALADEEGQGWVFSDHLRLQGHARESYRAAARRVLTAALSVCDVAPPESGADRDVMALQDFDAAERNVPAVTDPPTKGGSDE